MSHSTEARPLTDDGAGRWGRLMPLLGAGAALIATMFLFHRLMLLMTFYGLSPDFPDHNTFIHDTRLSGRLSAHFLYAVLVLGFQLLYEQLGVPYGDYRAASYTVAMLSVVLAAVTSFYLLRSLSPRVRATTHFLLALSLLFVAPLWMFGPRDGLMYFGYLAPNSYHNPTVLLVKPIALVTTYFVWRAFVTHSGLRVVAAAAAVTVLAAAAKPSHLIAILPASGVVALWFKLRSRPIDFRLLVIGVWAPAVAVLVWQYLRVYGTSDAKHHIVFAPLLAFRLTSGHLFVKFLLSIIFPAVVFVVFRRSAVRDTALILTSATFVVAATYGYLLAESGREFHGNFSWGTQISIWILLVLSVLHVLNNAKSQRAAIACWSAFGLHVMAGLLYILVMFYRKAAAPSTHDFLFR